MGAWSAAQVAGRRAYGMEPTDIELMLRARGGDLRAFQQLVERYRAPLRRFFAALLADRSQADDCVQETFLRLWLLRDRYEPTGRFSTYLFQIGKHHLLNERRKAAAIPVRSVEEGDQEIWLATDGQPEKLLLQRDRVARVRRAVDALPDIYRVVFRLSHYEGLKYAEIACRLQIPVGTVKSRMAEAVRRLRETLSEDEPNISPSL